MLLENRLIGFFDILGFSQKLEDMDIHELYEFYSELINKANKEAFSPETSYPDGRKDLKTNFAYSKIFSDSIIVVSNPLSPNSVMDFIFATNQMFEMFFEKHFPLRGIINIDDVLIDEEKNIFLAKKFPSMVRAEKEYDWVGGVLTPDTYPIIFEQIFGGDIREREGWVTAENPCLFHDVPLKGGGSKAELCLNWAHFLSNSKIPQALDHLIEPKRQHTKGFIEKVRSLPHQKLSLPAEALPATQAIFMKARSGLRVRTSNQNDEAVDPAVMNLALVTPQ